MTERSIHLSIHPTFPAARPGDKMPATPSALAMRALRALALPLPIRPAQPRLALLRPILPPTPTPRSFFSTTSGKQITLNQVRRKGRDVKRERRSLSPAMIGRPEMKGVCLKVGITKPKKPNSGQRKTAKVRLSSGQVVSAYIPGEGESFLGLLFQRFFFFGGWARMRACFLGLKGGEGEMVMGFQGLMLSWCCGICRAQCTATQCGHG